MISSLFGSTLPLACAVPVIAGPALPRVRTCVLVSLHAAFDARTLFLTPMSRAETQASFETLLRLPDWAAKDRSLLCCYGGMCVQCAGIIETGDCGVALNRTSEFIDACPVA